MQTTNTWNKLHLHWRKIIALLLFVSLGFPGIAQNNPKENLINYDDQWIHYGFLIGIHSSKYVINYSEAFTSPAMDTVHSIVPGNMGGFKIGFVIDMNVFQYLDFRILPTVGFYENNLKYQFTDGSSIRAFKDATMVELPLLLKYKSVRRGNVTMYLIGGVNPSFEASGKGDAQDKAEKLELKNWNIAIDIGAGFDLYYPFFKFSPEVRYSYGLRNMLVEPGNKFNQGLDKLFTHNLGIFITFEGGPGYLKKRGGKLKSGRK